MRLKFPKDLRGGLKLLAPLLLSVDLTAGYQLWGRPDRGGIAYLGIGYDRIDEEDSQKISNHIKASIGPELLVGLRIRY